MSDKMLNPYIHTNEDNSIEIVGNAESLEALGSLLVAKSKLKQNLVAELRDGVNPVIHITCTFIPE